jgi:hypothetical protein
MGFKLYIPASRVLYTGGYTYKTSVLERSGREMSGNEGPAKKGPGHERSGSKRSGRKGPDAKGPDSFISKKNPVQYLT